MARTFSEGEKEEENWKKDVSRSVSEADARGTSQSKQTGTTTGSSRHDATHYPDELRRIVANAYVQGIGFSAQNSQSDTQGTTHTNTKTISGGQTAGTGGGRGKNRSRSEASATTSSRGGSLAFTETVIPRFKMIKQLASVEYESFDEHAVMRSQELMLFAPGDCYIITPGMRPIHVRLPLLDNPADTVPKSLAAQTKNLYHLLGEQTAYILPAQVERYDREMLEHVVASLDTIVPQSINDVTNDVELLDPELFSESDPDDPYADPVDDYDEDDV
jgi:hypothetical protein